MRWRFCCRGLGGAICFQIGCVGVVKRSCGNKTKDLVLSCLAGMSVRVFLWVIQVCSEKHFEFRLASAAISFMNICRTVSSVIRALARPKERGEGRMFYLVLLVCKDLFGFRDRYFS